MRGLEERLRLALEGTETGFWEWHVASEAVEWSENMGPLYGLPRGTQPAGVDRRWPVRRVTVDVRVLPIGMHR